MTSIWCRQIMTASISLEQLLTMKVDLTMIGGRIIYDRLKPSDQN